MYNRAYGQRRPPTLPQNYSGNAFYRVPPEQLRPDPPPEDDNRCECEPERQCEQEQPSVDCSCEKECCECRHDECEKGKSLSGLPFFKNRGRLFPRGIGTEELLILALILITSSGDENNDLFFFLILLLFC